MRRREKAQKLSVPKSVAVYVSADWSGRNESERMSAWADARNVWKDENGVDFLAGDDYYIPDAPFYPEDI